MRVPFFTKSDNNLDILQFGVFPHSLIHKSNSHERLVTFYSAFFDKHNDVFGLSAADGIQNN